MLVQVQGLVQADFLLQVRRADLALISTKELDIMMNTMVGILNSIIVKGYLVQLKVTIDGVTTLIKG